MKRNEIISRQNRVVYVLLVVTALLALAWTLWRHAHPPAPAPKPALTQQLAPGQNTTATRTSVRVAVRLITA